MQIVIDIPEELYDEILRDIEKAETAGVKLNDLCIAFKNGTPLPKGHGALKDADEVFAVMERNFDMQELYLPIHFMQFAMDEAQTIIEADEEANE